MDAAFIKVHHRSPNLRAKPKPCLNGGMLLCLDIASGDLPTECREETSQWPADLPIRLAKPSVDLFRSFLFMYMRHTAHIQCATLREQSQQFYVIPDLAPAAKGCFRFCTPGQRMLPKAPFHA
jgi:hypothetical protein